jgi:GTPase
MTKVFAYPTKVESEKAILVAVDTEQPGCWKVEESLNELAELTRAAGSMVVGRLVQRLSAPNRRSYLGKGKLAELLQQKSNLGYNLVIFDDELTPLQQQNLEKELKAKIIDRAALILDIFARAAHTREGKLQVELAQHQYLLPRLAGQWSHLERLGGGVGTRGPGESQLETDRRLIRRKIARLKEQLEEVRTHRALYREKRRRSGIPVVAMVGYTNTGKSTLLNSLSRAGVRAEDKLFATLDPTTRRLCLPGKTMVLFTDTVGFIHKLPPTLVEAFRATLEELQEASLLVHVVDLTSHNAVEQCQVVEDVLADLGLEAKPRVTALNKIDLLVDKSRSWDEYSAIDFLSHLVAGSDDTVLISATKMWGLRQLQNRIVSILHRMINPETVAGITDAL